MALIDNGEDDALVAFRLQYDVPEDMPDMINSLTLGTEQLKTNLEAISRFSGSHAETIAQIVELSADYTALEQQIAETAERRAIADERSSAALREARELKEAMSATESAQAPESGTQTPSRVPEPLVQAEGESDRHYREVQRILEETFQRLYDDGDLRRTDQPRSNSLSGAVTENPEINTGIRDELREISDEMGSLRQSRSDDSVAQIAQDAQRDISEMDREIEALAAPSVTAQESETPEARPSTEEPGRGGRETFEEARQSYEPEDDPSLRGIPESGEPTSQADREAAQVMDPETTRKIEGLRDSLQNSIDFVSESIDEEVGSVSETKEARRSRRRATEEATGGQRPEAQESIEGLPRRSSDEDQFSSQQNDTPQRRQEIPEAEPSHEKPERPNRREAPERPQKSFEERLNERMRNVERGTSSAFETLRGGRDGGIAETLGGVERTGQSLNLGGLGAVGGVAARALPVVGGAALAAGAVDQGMKQYEQTRQLGQVTGDGFSEGMGYEMAIRQMAMNPFISTQQSRDIVMSALNEGYTGEEFDTLTEYMATNLRQMNMTTKESMDLFQSSVVEGGQSIEGLTTQLDTLKQTASAGNQSLDSVTSQFQQVTSQAVDMGVEGDEAGRTGMYAANLFQDLEEGETSALAGEGADFYNNMIMRNRAFVATQGESGEMFADTQERLLEDPEQALGQMDEFLREQVFEQAGDNDQRARQILANQGMNYTIPQIRELREQVDQEGGLAAGPNQVLDEAIAPEERAEDVDDMVQKDGIGGLKRFGRGALAFGATEAGKFNEFFYGAIGMDEKAEDRRETWDERAGNLRRENEVEALFGGSMGRSEVLESAVRQHGAGEVYLDFEGERQKLSDMDMSEYDLEKITEEAEISIGKKGEGMSFREFAETGGMEDGEDDKKKDKEGEGQTIGLTEEASRLVQLMDGGQATSNQERSLSGFGSATLNDAPVGDR